jgi:hypothetical protein
MTPDKQLIAHALIAANAVGIGTPLVLLWACLSMAAKDATGTLMNVAENRGRGHLAGLLDAGNDGAVVLTTLFGAGQVVLHGWTLLSLATIAVIMATSYCGTRFWTQASRRLLPDESALLRARLDVLEAALRAAGIGIPDGARGQAD